ncbi:transaldolase family protein [Anaerolentibacter hominis]|uniref:transaldolase family protein n=1 Tax=Anaerolentibacter hominis TaxID=3079009 RepID=UPI0031B7F256
MKLIIDSADTKIIRELYDYFPAKGVTTNPSILKASGRAPYDVLREIRDIIGADGQLHVQVVSQEAETMEEEAFRIRKELGENTYIKVPVTREGLKAIKRMSANGIQVTATAIYTPMQAYLAAEAGAVYTAPYVNRIDNLGYDGVSAAIHMHDIFRSNNLNTQVLAASFKNSYQVLELCRHGIGAATLAPDIIEGLVKNENVAAAVDAFEADFFLLCGESKNMSDC